MRAMVLDKQAPIDDAPLAFRDMPVPEPGAGEVRLRVRACGICRTDLHIIEGDLEARRLPLIPGHQIVGVVDEVGESVDETWRGRRVGVPWVHRTCGACRFCKSGRENLCENIRFTGYDVHGGYAEYACAAADFVVPLPEDAGDLDMAPLLCAGVIGYRALKLSGAAKGDVLGMVGFGASAHVTIQVARHLGIEVHAATRAVSHRRHAEELGASWTGSIDDAPPAPWNAAIIFAPAGSTVPKALRHMDKGATIALAGIHMSPIPEINYDDLWGERVIRSVANMTRDDARELIEIAHEAKVRTKVNTYSLDEANRGLAEMKSSAIDGAAVLVVDE